MAKLLQSVNYFGLVILFSAAACSYECDIFPATHTIAADYGSVINTLNCNTTVAVYNFTILWPDTFELQTKLICKYSDTGKVHSASFSDQSYSRNTRIGAVYYSSLEPPLPTDTLPEGSECQLYGCTLSSDFATYWEIEGERCIISLSDVDIDECLEGKHYCSKYARCKNSYGRYRCECLTGFKGDGKTCTLSVEVTTGITVTAGLVLVGGFLCLIMCTTERVKAGRYFRTYFGLTPIRHREDVHHGINETYGIAETSTNDEDPATAPESYVVFRNLKFPQTLIIKSADLTVLDQVGQGEFGIVYKGCLTGQFSDEVVAIRILKGFIDTNTIQELLSECDKMKNFANLHVMSLKGVCLDGGPVPYIVLPYMANGSLLSYLKKELNNLVVMKDNDIENKARSAQVLFVRKRLMDMCLQVARGMEYLTCKKVVHRDLAARNCMIDINMIIKVADFGLSVNIGAKEYYRLTKHVDVKLPVKWMAPESLADYMFSEMSDVWSYGVTCWEIFTGGQAPYACVRPSALLSFLQGGERLEMPNNSACNDDLYSMMQQCWEMEPDKRPSFSTLVNTLSKSLEKQAGYLRVGAFTTGNNRDSNNSWNEELTSQ